LKDTVDIEVDGHRLKISNMDKVLWPATGFTKAQMIDYYTRIAPVMVPHLAGHPVTLKRYPDGVDAQYFYEKECPAYHPDWVSTATMPSRNVRQRVNFCIVDEVATLVWLANLATIELHTLLAEGDDLDRPKFIAFDLDPGPPADVTDAAWAAERLREVLEDSGLESFPKVSGSKGIHVYVPLNTKVTYEKSKAFAKAVARNLEKRYPERITSIMRKDARGGKIFVDWSQNDPHKTTVCVYSLRAREKPYVSTPVTWDELEEARRHGKPGPLYFEAWEALKRVEDMGDIFEPVLKLKQKLPQPPEASG
jgi:bifunctional non-homologous end joining protein LigD